MARFRRDKGPDGPTDVGRTGWWAALKRTVHEFREDNLTDWAAALTYYGVLAIFPALIVLIVGPGAHRRVRHPAAPRRPREGRARARATTSSRARSRTFRATRALPACSSSSASSPRSGRPPATSPPSCAPPTRSTTSRRAGRIWKTLPVRVGMTIVLLLLLAVTTLAVVLTGGLAKKAGDVIGLGSTAVTVWNIAKWPVLLLIVSLMFALLYWAAPNVKQPGFRWVSPGRHPRGGRVADRVGRLRALRVELRLLQQDLRRARPA